MRSDLTMPSMVVASAGRPALPYPMIMSPLKKRNWARSSSIDRMIRVHAFVLCSQILS